VTWTLRDGWTADAAASPETDRSHKTTASSCALLFGTDGYEKHIASSRAKRVKKKWHVIL